MNKKKRLLLGRGLLIVLSCLMTTPAYAVQIEIAPVSIDLYAEAWTTEDYDSMSRSSEGPYDAWAQYGGYLAVQTGGWLRSRSETIVDNEMLNSSANIYADAHRFINDCNTTACGGGGSAHVFGTYTMNLTSDYGSTGPVEVFFSVTVYGYQRSWEILGVELVQTELLGPEHFLDTQGTFGGTEGFASYSALLELGVDYTVNISAINEGTFGAGTYLDIMTTEPIPEPSTIILLGTGLIGLAGFGRKKFIKR